MTKIALLVDDEPLIREVLREKLKQHFDGFLEASNGAEGVQLLQENASIMAVISDIKMPVMDGLQFLEQARSIGYQGSFVFFAAFANRAMIEKGTQLGAHAFVDKGAMDGLEQTLLESLHVCATRS